MSRVCLTHKQAFELANFVKANYEAKAVTDVAFAVEASVALGFPINSNNVATAREVVGLKATRDTQRERNSQTLEGALERIGVLELTVEDLERKVAALQQSVKVGGRV